MSVRHSPHQLSHQAALFCQWQQVYQLHQAGRCSGICCRQTQLKNILDGQAVSVLEADKHYSQQDNKCRTASLIFRANLEIIYRAISLAQIIEIISSAYMQLYCRLGRRAGIAELRDIRYRSLRRHYRNAISAHSGGHAIWCGVSW